MEVSSLKTKTKTKKNDILAVGHLKKVWEKSFFKKRKERRNKKLLVM